MPDSSVLTAVPPPSRRPGMRLILPLLLLGSFLTAGPRLAEARITRAVSIDGASAQSEAVVLATITAVRPAGAGRYQRVPVVQLDVTCRVVLSYKGSPAGATLVVRHLRSRPNQQPMVNGYYFADLVVGRTYLLFLERDAGGRLVLGANEDAPIWLSAAEVGVARRLPRRGVVATRVVDLLERLLSLRTQDTGRIVWLLSQAALVRRRIAAPAGRRVWIAALERVIRVATRENDLGAAYTILGRLGETRILPALIARICTPAVKGGTLPANRVGWLQGFKPAVQIKALEKVARCTTDPHTRRAAAWKASYLRKLRP